MIELAPRGTAAKITFSQLQASFAGKKIPWKGMASASLTEVTIEMMSTSKW